MCGDWERAAIFAAWPEAIAFELASFVWPITGMPELLRLLQGLQHATPVSVCGGEFSATCRAENERVHREVTLSVDLRASLVPGVHACMDMRLVLLTQEVAPSLPLPAVHAPNPQRHHVALLQRAGRAHVLWHPLCHMVLLRAGLHAPCRAAGHACAGLLYAAHAADKKHRGGRCRRQNLLLLRARADADPPHMRAAQGHRRARQAQRLCQRRRT